ncbi:hypothetical protein [Pseudidiomarina taiwanensis]|uniref:Translesion DNA synthesis-associated protein ImuA n=1 Tax=Pseudidiomarina taiwanensis TaxID=337250 RepID=A0A432ZF22_9GAMM|nr:hypothetical protein [Pseudidiomarina taiwanensis]RUO76521.1 hypothetical protein CWI83_09200 [Pseudidiomarina taiwanensis]
MAASHLHELVAKGWVWQGQDLPAQKLQQQFIESGWSELDQHLGGGWLQGSVNELQLHAPFSGELAFLMPLLQQQTRPTVWLNPPCQPYAPGLRYQQLEPDLQWCLYESDPLKAVWAIEQCLQAQQVGVVLAWLPELSAACVRRLQQTAEQQQQLVFIFTPSKTATTEARAYVNRLRLYWHDGLHVEILKRRFGWPLAAFRCPVEDFLPERRRSAQQSAT